uniref:Uncharacterized protein n=1 Tax=Heterorhabditis bacteriophora TaxID=37862 RepID=A0A1I7WHM0_HETBA
MTAPSCWKFIPFIFVETNSNNNCIKNNSSLQINNQLGKVMITKIQGDWDYDAVRKTGYSTRLAQFVVVTCIFAGVTFFCGSHKQKGDHAATAEFEIEDRPIHIGR